jgi:hypothetical protein
MAYESELEAELEGEFEDESEEELEGEDFLGGLLGEGEEESEDFLGSILGEEEAEDFLGDILGEGEDEYEAEEEYEEEISPIRKIYPDAVMEHLGELAAESESEEEAAEHFLPLIGMAASKLLPVMAKAIAPKAKQVLPKIAKVLTKATPGLTRGIGNVAKALHRNPKTRHLLRTVPSIARRTVGNLAHKAARGANITPHTAVRTLTRQARHVLGTPQHRAQALRRHSHLERKLHRRRGIARPHGRYGRRYGRGGRMNGGLPGYAASRSGAPRMMRGVPRAGMRRAAGAHPIRYGRAASGQCACQHCSNCCGCCGQTLRQQA